VSADGAKALEDAARRIAELVNRASPNAGSMAKFEALTIAAGMFLGDAVFPAPDQSVFERGGTLLACGLRLGFEDRAKTEKESCRGNA